MIFFGSAALIIPPTPSPYRLPQYPLPTSTCGPITVNFFASARVLRICTPLLPTPSLSCTLQVISKSEYFFLLQKNVLYFGSSLVSPTTESFSIRQRSERPSQLSGFRKSSVSLAITGAGTK